ncbi:MAG: GTPase Era, partial [Bacteroidetes bacterium]
NKFIDTALIDADIILLMTEVGKPFAQEDILDKINRAGIPVLVIINKIDLSDQEKVVAEMAIWDKRLLSSEAIPISALNKFNIEKVFDRILFYLPESPPYFSKDEFTDKSMRFFVSEIIREKILTNFKKEIPYSAEVAVEEYKEEPRITRITANIFVARESQKAIILGHLGKAIKKVGTQARIDIEEFTGKKVFLELTVKVKKDWRDSETQLKRFGYEH